MYTLQYKELAKEQMKGNMHTLVGGWLLYLVLYYLIDYPFSTLINTFKIPFPEGSFLFLLAEYTIFYLGVFPVAFLTGVFSQGLTSIQLNLSNNMNVELGDLFSQMSFFIGCGILTLIINIAFFILPFFFFFPLIIGYYALSMAPFVYVDDPYMSPLEAISESIRIMNGHKIDLFKLHLNFLLWILLGFVTLGLAFIYVVPYVLQAEANFYNDIK